MADEKKVSGKTRAGTTAKPFPWEEAIGEQYERTKSRLKGLATEPEAELQRILEQYLPKKSDSREERMQKLEDLAMGFAGTTKLPTPKLARASEVFGPHEGKTAMFTESDRTKVGGGFLGGPGFSSLQLELPAYEGKSWGVASMPKAQTIIRSNQRVPEGQAIWSTYIGHPEQHRSNQMVFDQIFNQFRREAKKGNLPNELRESINERLATQLDANNNPLFPPDVDIMGKNFRQLANTFDRRAAAAEIMGGKGVGGKKGSIIDYPGIIESTTDPALVGAPTWAVGPRVFTLTNEVGVHPELQPAFPYVLHGEDLGKVFEPVPHNLAMMDFIEKVKREKGRKMGYMDLARGYAPQQFISEEWLTALQKAGYADGGLAQYGLRHSGEGVKGKGYFGPMAGRDGTVTELSAEDESGEFPLVVPTLTAEELDRLLAGGEPTPEMLDKASSWAATRRKRGESPFASPTELRMPRPKAEGGAANLTDLPDEVNPSNWREHLQNNVLADARALLGVKDGGVINLDELIEKSLKKKDGGVINLDELIAWTMAKDEHRKMKEGGAVKMQGGGNPGEVAGEMFKPKPLSIPEPITDLVEALRRQFEKEKRSMRKPGAVQDVLMRGPAAAYMGAPADIVGMGGELLDYAQKKIPALRKPASVMDTGPEKVPPMGYAPAFPLSPEGSYGTTAAQELMGKAGLTTGEERPLFELGATAAAPIAGYAGFKAGKALAPTAMEMLDVELANMMKPYQMAVAPEGKAGKIKAPANPVGFYNPAEKAALNLQRKKGPGSAFISDLKKQPGVTDERIAELGLTDLASNPNVTREDVIAAVEQNRIPLRESVRRPYQESDEFSETADALKESIRFREGGIQQVQAELDRVRATAPDSPLVQQYERKIETMRESIARDQQKLEAAKPSLYGPDSHPDYNMPGGENYREIRVALPENKAELPSMEGFTVETANENKFTGQRDIYIRDPQGNIVTNRYGFRGDDAQALRDEATSRARDASKDDNFYHRTHHGDEPNVLFHLRVADHVDEEGKKGLLIDELQSDWHQKGREKGYRGQDTTGWRVRGTNENDPSEVEVLDASGRSIWQGLAKGTDRQIIEYAAKKEAVPDAPFKDNWYQLGLKRAIKEAADTGMDRVYLTTGARQADRYDLSKKVEAITATKGSDQVHIQVALDGVNSKSLGNFPLEGNALDEAVGKELAEKIRAQSGIGSLHRKRYEGVDLKVGGEGMKQYYDKNYKNYLEKYAKQHGGKLGMTKIADGEPVYYIDITDAMRESAKKGQSYAFGGGVFNTDPDITDSGRIIPEHTI